MNSSNDTYWKKTAYIATVPPLLTLSVAAILSNSYVIIKFCHLRRRLTVNMKLTFSLAIADLWVSTLMLLNLVGNSLIPQIFERKYASMACLVLTLETFRLGAIITSILHMLFLSANQCFSIVSPFAHKVLITSKICKLTLAVVWLAPACCFFIHFYSIPNQGYRSNMCINLWPYQKRPFRTTVFILIAVPMVLVTTMYALIMVYVKKSTNSKGIILNAISKRASFSKRQIQTIITTVLVVGTFVLSWFPSILLHLLVCQDCIFRLFEVNPRLIFALGVTKTSLVLIKLSLNPFIYSPSLKVMEKFNVGKNLRRRSDKGIRSSMDGFQRDMAESLRASEHIL